MSDNDATNVSPYTYAAPLLRATPLRVMETLRLVELTAARLIICVPAVIEREQYALCVM